MLDNITQLRWTPSANSVEQMKQACIIGFISGAFRVEMQRESQKDRTILCKYEPTEPGDYRIEVSAVTKPNTGPGDYMIEVSAVTKLNTELSSLNDTDREYILFFSKKLHEDILYSESNSLNV